MAYYPSVIPTLISPAIDPNGIGDASTKANGGTPKPRATSIYADELKNILYNIRGMAVALGLPTGSGSAFDQIASIIAGTGLADNAVTDAKLRDSAAVSVIGRSVNSAGDPADITAGANDRLLTRVADVLAFTQLTLGMIPDALITTIKILDNNITNAKLRDSAAVSVIGRSANSSGDPADIPASANDRILARVADVLDFVQITIGMIPDGLITLAKLETAAALSVPGRSANSTGARADLTAGTDGHALRRSGTTLGFGQIATGGIADGNVTLAKLANATAVSVLGRSANSAGVYADIAAGADDRLLARVAGALSFVQLTLGMIPNNLITDLKMANWPSASIHKPSAGQVLTSGAGIATITGTTTLRAPTGGANAPTINNTNGSITIAQGGRYRITAYLGTTAGTSIAAGSFLQIHIQVGGVTQRRGDFPYAFGTVNSLIGGTVSALVDMGPGDVVTMAAAQNTGNNQTTLTNTGDTAELSLELIGPTI
jgi:hypothetical protein